MKEIVGAKIGSIITNNRETIKYHFNQGTSMEWLDRHRMELMVNMDLGINWVSMAKGPTLFCLDDEGKPHPAN